MLIVRKVLFTFGFVVLLSASASQPVVAQAKGVSTVCGRWLKIIDPSLGKSSFAISFRIPENERLAAMECFLQSKGNLTSLSTGDQHEFQRRNVSTAPTIEIAALYYVTYMFEEKWDHAGGIALWNKKAEINPPGSVQEAYRCYREWLVKLKELGLAEVKKQGLGPLDKSSVQWFLMDWPEKPPRSSNRSDRPA